MIKIFYLIATSLLIFWPAESFGQAQAERIIDRVIEAAGGMSAWRELKDVTYQETHRRFENGQWSQPITRTMQMFLGKRLASVVLLLVGKRRGASGVPSPLN